MTAQVDPLFQQAITAYQEKRYEQAAALCRKLRDSNPDHGGSLHLLGVVQYLLGHGDEAETLLRQSVTQRPGLPEMHYSFAQVLAARGKNAEAIVQYQCVLVIKPQHVEALFALGNLFKGEGRVNEAEENYQAVLRLKPDHAEALNNLGVIAFEKQAWSDAEAYHRRALALRPHYPAALNNLGNALKAQQQWGEAIDCYSRALAQQPDLLPALNNLGLALLYGRGDSDAAAACFDRLLELDPDHVPALTHKGMILCMQSAFASALAFYDRALTLAPDYRDALNNRANALRALGRMEEALADYRRVVAMQPDDPESQHNLAVALLTVGQFEEGWAMYDSRWRSVQMAEVRRDFTQPQWRGEAGQGRTLLIHAEQGFGDTLQFCRYVALAVERGWRVVLEVQPELMRLMRGVAAVDRITTRGEVLPPFDAHCPMLSLPLACATRLESIPAPIPYIHVDAAAAAMWRDRVTGDARLKVGLLWSGNPRLFSPDLSAANRRRSIDPVYLGVLHGIEGVQFYNLQKNATVFPPALDLVDWMPECHDFADTAALIQSLDLVISVDTAVAHLAGALGKPVWLLNRADTCWRWLQGRDDSPWYPTLRQFRQSVPGRWEDVVERVRAELVLLTKK